MTIWQAYTFNNALLYTLYIVCLSIVEFRNVCVALRKINNQSKNFSILYITKPKPPSKYKHISTFTYILVYILSIIMVNNVYTWTILFVFISGFRETRRIRIQYTVKFNVTYIQNILNSYPLSSVLLTKNRYDMKYTHPSVCVNVTLYNVRLYMRNVCMEKIRKSFTTLLYIIFFFFHCRSSCSSKPTY